MIFLTLELTVVCLANRVSFLTVELNSISSCQNGKNRIEEFCSVCFSVLWMSFFVWYVLVVYYACSIYVCVLKATHGTHVTFVHSLLFWGGPHCMKAAASPTVARIASAKEELRNLRLRPSSSSSSSSSLLSAAVLLCSWIYLT